LGQSCVAKVGFEPTILTAEPFEDSVYPIPPLGHEPGEAGFLAPEVPQPDQTSLADSTRLVNASYFL
jgi:hypothetical protein